MPRRPDRDMYCSDIEWLLTESSAALGERSSFSSFIRTLQSGHSTKTYDPRDADPYTDWQVGMGPAGRGAFERHRRVWRLWTQLCPAHQHVLVLRYTWTCRVRLRKPNGDEYWADAPTGVRSELGEVAGVVLEMARRFDEIDNGDRIARVLDACATHDSAALTSIVQEATEAVREAHTAYYELETAEWLSPTIPRSEGPTEAATA